MSETKLIVRRESLPARCEICHQTDLFDAQTGICKRCEAVRPIEGTPFPAEFNVPQRIQGTGWAQFLLGAYAFMALMCGGVCAPLPRDPEGNFIRLLIFASAGVAIFFLVALWRQDRKLR